MISVVFSSNDNHAMLLGVALCSLFENKKGDYLVQVFVMDGGISLQNKKRLEILEKRYHFNIKYLFPDDSLFAGIVPKTHSTAAYYRVTIGDLLPKECHKVIYCDCDVIFTGDVQAFFDRDLEGKTVGAALDHPQEWWREHLKTLCKELAIPAPRELRYFNSGVLLIDLDRWRERGIGAKLLAFIREHPDRLWIADQDPLNIALIDDWMPIERKYNYIAEVAATIGGEKPLIIHFAGGGKAWYLLSALPHQPEYVRYANLTPWKWKKYRKFMDVHFAKKYGFYPVAWWARGAYKKIKGKFTAQGRARN